MFLGTKTGSVEEDKYKFIGLGLSVDRFWDVLEGMDRAETEWAVGYHLSKSEKKKIDWPKHCDEAVGRFLKVENQKLANEKIFVRFGYSMNSTTDAYGPIAMFPENQTQYEGWKNDMFR